MSGYNLVAMGKNANALLEFQYKKTTYLKYYAHANWTKLYCAHNLGHSKRIIARVLANCSRHILLQKTDPMLM